MTVVVLPPGRPDVARSAAPDGGAGPRRGRHRALAGGARRRGCAAADPARTRTAAAQGGPDRHRRPVLPLRAAAAHAGPRPAASRWSTTARPRWSSSPRLARGERLVRWHRRGSSRRRASWSSPRSRPPPAAGFTPSRTRTVEVFTAMPVDGSGRHHGHPQPLRLDPRPLRPAAAHPGRRPGRHLPGRDRAWSTRSSTWRRSPPWPGPTVRPATSPTAGSPPEKLHALDAATGLEIVRPDLPLELIARRGPIGRTVLSFPSTVVHTLPLALVGTGGQGRGLRHRPGMAAGHGVAARAGLPERSHRDGARRTAAGPVAGDRGDEGLRAPLRRRTPTEGRRRSVSRVESGPATGHGARLRGITGEFTHLHLTAHAPTPYFVPLCG